MINAKEIVKHLKDPYNCIVKNKAGIVCISDVEPSFYNNDWLFGKCGIFEIIKNIDIEWDSNEIKDCIATKNSKKNEDISEEELEEMEQILINKIEDYIEIPKTFEVMKQTINLDDMKNIMEELREINPEKYFELRAEITKKYNKLKIESEKNRRK